MAQSLVALGEHSVIDGGLCLPFLQQLQLATAVFLPGSAHPFTGPRVMDLAVH